MNNGICISGVPLDNVTMREAIERIEGFVKSGGPHQVATANVDYLLNATQDLEYRRILCMCDLVVADGMPIVWASRLFGAPLCERVAGADLVPELARLSGAKGYGIFLLGAAPAVSEAAARRMKALSPGVRIVGRLSPPVRPLEEVDDEGILEEIARARPDILLVAFGSPKQEKWIARNRHRMKVPVAIGIGGSLDFLAGSVPRAPEWMREYGLEWLYRMWAEPRRLAPRYLRDAGWVARHLTAQLMTNYLGGRRNIGLRISFDSIGTVQIVQISGAMNGAQLSTIEHTLNSAIPQGPVVLDLAETRHIGPDGLWALAGMLRRVSKQGSVLWLAGLSPKLTRNLRIARFDGLIRSATSTIEAVRQVSPGRLQISLELGDSWVTCRIGGEAPQSARGALEQICQTIRLRYDNFELDATGMANFDPGDLLSLPKQSGGRFVYVDVPQRARAADAA